MVASFLDFRRRILCGLRSRAVVRLASLTVQPTSSDRVYRFLLGQPSSSCAFCKRPLGQLTTASTPITFSNFPPESPELCLPVIVSPRTTLDFVPAVGNKELQQKAASESERGLGQRRPLAVACSIYSKFAIMSSILLVILSTTSCTGRSPSTAWEISLL